MHVEICIFYRLAAWLLAAWLLAACTSATNEANLPASSQPPLERIVPSATMLPTPTAYPWNSANEVMSGLCFESVADAAGKTFIIRSADELARFFDLADNSQLCRRPVRRATFDFSGDTFLVGLWSKTVGCKARHDVVGVRRDDVALTYVISLRLVVDGGCAYELVRPFWIALSGLAGYDVRLLVQ